MIAELKASVLLAMAALNPPSVKAVAKPRAGTAASEATSPMQSCGSSFRVSRWTQVWVDRFPAVTWSMAVSPPTELLFVSV
jgi:hypothetical protein